MRQTLKRYFIPHEENRYHPHILHTKRAALYAGLCIAMKGIVFLFVLLLPAEVFMLPDVLEKERAAIIAMTNTLRARPLAEDAALNRSSELRTADMAAREYFDHISPDGRDLRYFLSQAGYRYAVGGENLAMGFSSAEDVMDAWEKSPAHRANLVDTDFNDIGVGISAGSYGGVPTVFVAQHFGRASSSSPASAGGIVIQPTQSRVAWEETGPNGMALSATVRATGDIVGGEVLVGEYRIPLSRVETAPDTFAGAQEIARSPSSFFRVVTPPVARFTGVLGTVISAPIPWDRIVISGPTPIEKYIRSKSSLGGLTSLFRVERGIYLGFLLFFAAALALNIFIEIRKQHPHVIAQTTGLLALIALLFWV